MKLKEMTATFGRLEKATLRPGAGLTLIEAPNEWGKSTWCAFLRAMFYGFPARDRDKAGYLAEKNRYQPWSGSPMEGSVTLEWKGRDLTLYRGPKGATSWGAFSATWTATGEAIPALTGENCGEVLLGVSREVFERTAFVGQGEISLSPSADLEKRVAALASSGEEEVSFSQVERRLKDWLNRRKVNSRVGLIPELEGELEQVEATLERQGALLRQLQAAQQEKEKLEGQKAQLEGQLQAHAAALNAQQAQRRELAQADYDDLLGQIEAARRGAQALPTADVLRKAQGDLSYANTLAINLRMAEKALPDLRSKAEDGAAAQAADPYFGGQEPTQAAAQAQADHDEVVRLQKKVPSPLSLLGAPLGCAIALLISRALEGQPYSIPVLIVGALLGWAVVALPLFLLQKGRRKKAAALLSKYQAQGPQDILDRSADYARLCAAAQEAQRDLLSAEGERDRLSQQYQDLTGQLLDLVHPFAPEVTDLFGVSAALSRALQQGERYTVLQTKLEAAQRLLTALPSPAAHREGLTPAAAPVGDPAQLSAQLSAVNGELARASDAAARLQGELDSLGDPADREARRAALLEELDRRRGEYEAISAALESLKAADSLLRERFSPAVNQRAGEYLAALTGGKYDRAALTRQFQALAQEPGEVALRQDLALSGGAAQQLYLAARLAICDLALPQQEPCPIVLDDALDAFDDDRTALALDCLLSVAQRRQVLLFSCHHREEKMLAGKDATVVTLG